VKETKTALVWFRSDLRLGDNPALDYAIRHFDAVIPVFIFSPEEETPWEPGSAARWWLHHSLTSLDQDLRALGSRLVIRKGPALKTLFELIRGIKAQAVFWNRRYEPAIMQWDEQVKNKLSQAGIQVQSFNGSLLFEPGQIKNQQGAPYKVFTAYWNKVIASEPPPKPLKAPGQLTAPARRPQFLEIKALCLEPKVKWAAGLRKSWVPGEKAAQKNLRKFIASCITAYSIERDRPDHEGTSRLSPYLHFGEISPRRVWYSVRKNRNTIPYLRQIVWREFAHYLLYHFPHTPERPLRKEFEKFSWKTDKTLLKKWQKGRTGYPVVDAGMRELWVTGWMHNRVRMIAASFLVKDLMIPWQEGAKWFWDTLVDSDLANNTLGWQWVAGCGADAAPFFRIFNPVIQGEKFDPGGNYVRKWVPELSRLPDKFIHRPWDAPKPVLASAGLAYGKDYPARIVDHNASRRKALLAYEKMRRALLRHV